MEALKQIIDYILGFQAYVMLPVIIFILSLVFRIKIKEAVKASLTIGIGFIGIFTMFNFFISNVGPALEALIKRTGLHYNVLDVGWPPMATITWSFKLAPVLLVILIVLNIALLFFNLVDTANIDIWNYWHFIFMGALVYNATNNVLFAILATIVSDIVTIKIADYCAKDVQKFLGIKGISTPTLSGAVYYPIAKIMNNFIDKIPKLNKIEADPEYIQKKLGIMGEPMIIGLVLGILLGFSSGYDVKKILELGFSISAVVYILPIMSGILTKGLMPISDGMKEFLHKKAPHLKEKYIGLDLAVILGNQSVIVTGLILMPISLFLAFIIPGVNFIPLGDLPNIIGFEAMIIVACSGNIIRGLIICTPLIAGKLIVASKLSSVFTAIAKGVDIKFPGYEGEITSFLDGGNIFRFWILRLFEGRLWAFILIPLAVLIIYYYRKLELAQNDKERWKN
jgi:PTS system galactitol-specific IIC component